MPRLTGRTLDKARMHAMSAASELQNNVAPDADTLESIQYDLETALEIVSEKLEAQVEADIKAGKEA